MQYFTKFPTVNYRAVEIQDGLPQEIIRNVPNMTARLQSAIDAGAYDWYKVQDRDRPDLLAAQWYGASRYVWVILLSNNMRDLYDWPMTNLEFHDYMAKKYQTYEDGVGQNNGVTESQDTPYQYLWSNPATGQELIIDQHWYNETDPEAYPPPIPFDQKREISVYDYESLLNDQRRDIKQLYPQTFQNLLRQFDQVLAGA